MSDTIKNLTREAFERAIVKWRVEGAYVAEVWDYLKEEAAKPEARKLKAYRFRSGEIKFFDSILIPYKGEPPESAPEFDIHFPEEK